MIPSLLFKAYKIVLWKTPNHLWFQKFPRIPRNSNFSFPNPQRWCLPGIWKHLQTSLSSGWGPGVWPGAQALGWVRAQFCATPDLGNICWGCRAHLWPPSPCMTTSCLYPAPAPSTPAPWETWNRIPGVCLSHPWSGEKTRIAFAYLVFLLI